MKRLAACALVFAPALQAFESTDLHGLRLQVDAVDEPVFVEGVALHIRRVTGRDVPRLAMRVQERWARQGARIQQHASQSWQITARWAGTRSEVLQWRGDGDAAELLHSWFDTARTVAPRQAPPFRLPAPCAWQRHAAGAAGAQRFLQWSIRCEGERRRQWLAIKARIRQSGWTTTRETAQTLDLRQGDTQAMLLQAGTYPGAPLSFTWIQAAPAGASR